jgi:hypothetical protein
VLFKPLDPGWKKIRIPDNFSGSYEIVFWVKNTVFKFFDADPDPGLF